MARKWAQGFPVLVLVQLPDLWTTNWVLRLGGEELSPLGKFLAANGGLALLGMKAAVLVLWAVALWVFPRRWAWLRPGFRVGQAILVAGVLAGAGINAYQLLRFA